MVSEYLFMRPSVPRRRQQRQLRHGQITMVRIRRQLQLRKVHKVRILVICRNRMLFRWEWDQFHAIIFHLMISFNILWRNELIKMVEKYAKYIAKNKRNDN